MFKIIHILELDFLFNIVYHNIEEKVGEAPHVLVAEPCFAKKTKERSAIHAAIRKNQHLFPCCIGDYFGVAYAVLRVCDDAHYQTVKIA